MVSAKTLVSHCTIVISRRSIFTREARCVEMAQAARTAANAATSKAPHRRRSLSSGRRRRGRRRRRPIFGEASSTNITHRGGVGYDHGPSAAPFVDASRRDAWSLCRISPRGRALSREQTPLGVTPFPRVCARARASPLRGVNPICALRK